MKLKTMPLSFRVYDTIKGKMWYKAENGYWAETLNDEEVKLGDDDESIDGFGDLLINPRYIVSQDTGIADVNKSHIFTGDIVMIVDNGSDVDYRVGDRYVVSYDDGVLMLLVGNIFENRELSEVESGK